MTYCNLALISEGQFDLQTSAVAFCVKEAAPGQVAQVLDSDLRDEQQAGRQLHEEVVP